MKRGEKEIYKEIKKRGGKGVKGREGMEREEMRQSKRLYMWERDNNM